MALTTGDRSFILTLIEAVGVRVDAASKIADAGFVAIKARLDVLNGTVAQNCKDIATLRETGIKRVEYAHDRDQARSGRTDVTTAWRGWLSPIVSGLTVGLALKALGMLK